MKYETGFHSSNFSSTEVGQRDWVCWERTNYTLLTTRTVERINVGLWTRLGKAKGGASGWLAERERLLRDLKFLLAGISGRLPREVAMYAGRRFSSWNALIHRWGIWNDIRRRIWWQWPRSAHCYFKSSTGLQSGEVERAVSIIFRGGN